MITLTLFLLGTIFQPQLVEAAVEGANYYSSSLNDCYAFASAFQNTCADVKMAEASVATATDEEVECVSSKCSDNANPTEASPCTWKRVLCVTCRKSGTQVYIRAQSNGMPSHCYYQDKAPTPQDIDFEVLFNWQVSRTTILQKALNASALDAKLCNHTSTETDSVPEAADLVVSGANDMKRIVGISLNGVPIYSGINQSNYDTYYPVKKTKDEHVDRPPVDACLGMVDDDGAYHYYSASPCLLQSAAQLKNYSCDKEKTCNKNIADYITYGYSTAFQSVLPIGLAKDGRIIYGPFRIDGTQWETCDVDICNGRNMNGFYSYVSTGFFPYTVGCFGPGSNPQTSDMVVSCSNYPRQCPQTSKFSSFANQLINFAMSTLVVLMISFA